MKTAMCCCGSVSIELEDDVKLNALCHCDNCRKRTGSAFGHSLYFSRSALVSVSDKTGLLDFARELVQADVQLFSTGGTRRHLEEAGIAVRDVADYTGFPEMMDGRVKTLHPKVHGGILCRHDNPTDMQSLADHGIESFELVVVNLYPFEQTVAREGVTVAEAIERLGEDLGAGDASEELAGDSVDSAELQAQLSRRYTAYTPTPAPS